MLIGAPRELKNNEYRVGLTPDATAELLSHGHQVLIESGAGLGSGFSDDNYARAGARLVATAAEIFDQAELIVKVKEPLDVEVKQLRPDQVLFTYLHLAANLDLTRGLMASGAQCIAYETVRTPAGNLPLLAPMSEIAGRLAPQMGARFLEKENGGKGILLSGAPGAPPAQLLVLGAGNVGLQSTAIALGMGARVLVADNNLDALRRVELRFGFRAQTLFATRQTISETLTTTDLVICAALTVGAKAPMLIDRLMLQRMSAGSVIVDVAIDQGGCCETSRPTSHAQPVYAVDGVIHYCVTNMPGVVPRTSTIALNNATLPYIIALANKGWRTALSEDPALACGLEIAGGKLLSAPVASAHGLPLGKLTLC